MAAPMSRETVQNDNKANQDDDWSNDDDELLLDMIHKLEDKGNTRILSKGSLDVDVVSGSDVEEGEKTSETKDSQQPPPDLTSQDQSDTRSPLARFRPGYLWVSDLTRQNWCEQQMFYGFTVPGVVEENPVMTQGSNLHLARELAVHDVVQVKVTSSEDIWAIKLINLLASVNGFLNNVTVAREVPIFGAPCGEDVFIVGLIDELRFDPVAYTIDLHELKTRQHRSFPAKSQQAQHRLQVMLYKKLFDDLVTGSVTKETVAKHLRLDLERELGEEVRGHSDNQFASCWNLSQLMEHVFGKMQCLTRISQLGIEYVHQDSQEVLFKQPVDYSEDNLLTMYRDYLAFWRGQRSARGVDIEDAWKCQRCDYASICEWRQKKASEYSMKNRTANKMNKK